MTEQQRTPSDVYPSLCYDDAAAAIEWLCDVFGFEKRLVVPGPDGTVIHSELTYGTGVIMVGSPRAEEGRVSPRAASGVTTTFSVHVEDPDAHFARAKAAGAEIIDGLKDADYGSRGYMVKDLEGHRWYFATYRPGAWWDAEDCVEK